MGTFFMNAKPSTSRLRKKNYRSSPMRHSSSFILFVKVILLALAASAVLPFLIISTLPSLKLLLFHTLPSFWSFSCAIFTPKHLFLLLNLIILSILAMTHLHRQPAGTAPSPLQLARHDNSSHLRAVHLSDSQEMKLDDQEFSDLQLVDEAEDTNRDADAGGNDVQKLLDCSSDGDSRTGDTDGDQEDEAIIHTEKVMIFVSHKQEQESDRRVDDQSEVEEEGVRELAAPAAMESRLAAPAAMESRKAEEAESVEDGHHPDTLLSLSDQSLQGNDPPPPFGFDESLLSEEGSIFTRVESRPLPSARFTHKKASKQLSAVHDRPLRSISRPTIVKRGDTLEATWKAICESKRHSSPLHRHYSKHTKKVDSFEGFIDGVSSVFSSPLSSPIKQRSKKNSPLHDHELPTAHANAMTTTRKPSMPQEELNAKVESFISRFNEKIRIQREKSLLDYMEMVGRGTN